MGETIRLNADDGHALSAYHAAPHGPRKGGVVVIQEVFGVNAHIRDVCDRLSEAGYEAIAPALFDRVRGSVELGYDEAGIEEGRALVGELGWDAPLKDVWAAVKRLDEGGRVGVVGFCWGGTVSFLAACRLNVACAVAYYGRQIVDFPDDTRKCPMVMHFGAEDPLIPLETVQKVRATNPHVPIFIYEGAGHGFNCDRRADYRAEAAETAMNRTLAFFSQHLS
ncbi:MAG: dienelactone hydrolase family protein [Hyphomicrobiales bacterium]|nr:dienelactone hydrolase family protein [Hyphomicrobiales bacterium]